jgi:5-methylcytosine-specific restriction endonuclease McrA
MHQADHLQTAKTLETKTEVAPRHKTKRDINWRLRFLVMRKDNFKCVACGRNPANDKEIILHVDHILAWDKGGETVYENLQTLCSVCNIGKSNLDFKADKNGSH